ncbi:MAG: DNA methylase N-4 [Armatimonadetes bacterium CG2_30_59_28]|nr:MAG: DNA methylase N-4 [Armatimonadetes bacterium CG2_30_59_28]
MGRCQNVALPTLSPKGQLSIIVPVMQTAHRIIIGDSRNMAEVEEHSVHLVVTSPPYWQLKDYGHDGQIGFNDTYEDYINNLNLVWNECWRVLHPGCRLCINVGDQFARSVYYGRYKVIPIRTEIIKFCETVGFDYMGAIIWQKATTCNTTGGATIMGSFPYPRNGIVKLDYEFILLFKKPGKPPAVPRALKEQSKLTTEEWNQYFFGHWNFPGERQDTHLAAFPAELPRRLIRMFSFVDDMVLDPFLGSGTTTHVAIDLGRNSVGYEVNPDFLSVIRRKVGESTPERTIHFLEHTVESVDWSQRIASLPYIFRDPVAFDKKVDPRNLRFGSKIDGQEPETPRLHSVTRVESPDLVELDGKLRVRLLGVRPIAARRQEAIDFLRNATRGQKVLLKFDTQKYDARDNLLAYLYLRNKTFLNMHLIKRGLACVDTSLDFSCKGRFMNQFNSARERGLVGEIPSADALPPSNPFIPSS